MTVIIGIICREAIVLAADSQIIDTNSGIPTFIDKISVVEFRFGEILVAQAGLWPLTIKGS
jgi:20S proteasome alpha/beta subunit